MKIIDCREFGTGEARRHEPTVYIWPETAVVRKGTPFFVPAWAETWELHVRTGVEITRLGKGIDEKFAHRYRGKKILALCAVAADTKGPLVPGFDGSVLLSSIPEDIGGKEILEVNLSGLYPKEGKNKSSWNGTLDLSFDLSEADKAISVVSRYYTLHTGDLVLLPEVSSFRIPVIADTRCVVTGREGELLNYKIK